ncbi:MAG TPA: MFS transporter [Methanocorpusculum sp.]|nr:MFS transporter [Methanocorpusculum sp.]
MSRSFQAGKFTLFVLLFAGMPSILGTAAVAPVLGLMRDAFGAPEVVINLVLTLPPLATALSGFFIGALSDKVGRVKILSGALLFFGLAGVSGFFLEDLYAIIACRLVLGISIAGILPMVSALITEYYAPEIAARYLGYLSASNGICVTVLQTACGALAILGWHYSFLIYILGLAALPFVIIFLKEPVRKSQEEKSSSADEKPMPKVGMYVLVYLTMILCAVMMYLPTVNLSYYLAEAGISDSAFWTGLLLGVFGISSTITGILFWRIASRLSFGRIFALVFGLETAGLITIGISQNIFVICAGLILIGFALGLALPNASAWIGKITPGRVLGKFMSGVTVSIFVGLFCTTFAAPVLLGIVGAGNYAGMFLLCACAGLLLMVFWLIFGRKLAKKRGIGLENQ